MNCTTHHNACACREAMYVEALRALRASVDWWQGEFDKAQTEAEALRTERGALREAWDTRKTAEEHAAQPCCQAGFPYSELCPEGTRLYLAASEASEAVEASSDR